MKQLKIIKSAGGSRALEAGQSQGQAEQNKASSHLSVNQFSCISREGDGDGDTGPMVGQCQVMVDKYVLMQRLCNIPSNVECRVL